MQARKAAIALEDGAVFFGEATGADGEVEGEAVFTTAMTGYQEVLTDPSFAGQLVVFTYPLIGNVGVNTEDHQAHRIWVKGMVARELAPLASNWRSSQGVEEWLRAHGVVAVTGVDTRAITRRLRQQGSMRAVICTFPVDRVPSPESLVERARRVSPIEELDLVEQASTAEPVVLEGPGPTVVVLDLGAKQGILRELQARGLRVVVLPAGSGAGEILRHQPAGVVLSNGPGDPGRLTGVAATVRQLLGKIPLFGVCLGHQVLAMALGGRTFKLRYGHRGGNHPVREISTGRVLITSQNHGYAVDPASLPAEQVEVTHVSLNDGTVEGLCCPALGAWSVQFHPEASPGPRDARELFDRFVERLA